MRLGIDVPVNGRVRKATVTVYDDEGKGVLQDKADLVEMAERRKLAERLAKRLGKSADDLLAGLEAKWAEALNERRERLEQAEATAGEVPPNESAILDATPDAIRRPM